MKIKLIAIGTRMPVWVTAGFNEYQQRLPADYAIELTEISAAKRTKSSDLPRIIQREGEQMLAAIPAGNYVIALTERGQLWDTIKLAHQLTTWHDQGHDISLLVGGPEGLAPACLARANSKWSLSPLTFPHPLVRILLAEQIYRAYSIIQHHPYHRA